MRSYVWYILGCAFAGLGVVEATRGDWGQVVVCAMVTVFNGVVIWADPK